MSDPVTNVEIEDVLSSIRRLVSDGDKPRVRDSSAETGVTAQTAPAMTDRLVLTPAFRVPETEETATTGAAQQEAHESACENRSEDTITPVMPPKAQTHQPTDGSDTQPAPARSTLEATIAELEASVGSDEDFEPDHGSEEIQTVVWPGSACRLRADTTDAQEVAPSQDIPDSEPVFQHRNAAPDTSLQPQLDDGDIPDNDLHDKDLHDKDFHDEDYVADDADDFNPDTVTDDLNDHSDETLSAFLDDAGVMDEDMLRDLVTEIVRQELQGTMGERITRNVRKLVRREIHRILSSQEFD